MPASRSFVVRGAAILNDATMEDARDVGLMELVRVLDNGSDAPGTVVTDVCDDVRQLLESAEDMLRDSSADASMVTER